MTIYDRLYGPIEFSDAETSLFQTQEMARLRDVSLSAVPTWMIPTGTAATRFEHSVGVAHLTRSLNTNAIPISPEERQDLFCAALVHDVGTTPFSHLAERFLRQMTGKSHEEHAVTMLDGSEFAREVKNQGGSLDRILDYITGKRPPLGHLINGPLDLDTLDNTLRYGMSMGLLRTLLLTAQDLDRIYSPGAIAKALVFHNNEVVVHCSLEDELRRWIACREGVYNYVYSAANLASGSMLYRAIGFAVEAEEIREAFFRLTDSAACRFLEEQCNPRTRQLVERARQWNWYVPVFTFCHKYPVESLLGVIEAASTRIRLADHVTKEFHLPPEDVVTYTGKTRTSKTLPRLLSDGTLSARPGMQGPEWLVRVFVAPEHTQLKERISSFVWEFLQQHGAQ